MHISEFVKSLLSGLKGSVVSAKNTTIATADLVMSALTNHRVVFRNKYVTECYGPDGVLKWRDVTYNQVMTAGINDLLTNYFKGSAYTAAFFVGLVDNASFSAYAAADTMASHAGWLESAAYSNATRPSLTLGTPSAGSVDNSAAKAVFNINASATILGAFVATNSTKSGTTGVLYGAASFTGGSRAVQSGDTLNVTVTLSAS